MATHTIGINFLPGVPLAGWTLDGAVPPSNRIMVGSGETIQFDFANGDSVVNAVVLSGPLGSSFAPSPFQGGSQLNIYPGSSLVIDADEGAWGFSVMFSVTTGGVTSMYFLPDPELEVGSV